MVGRWGGGAVAAMAKWAQVAADGAQEQRQRKRATQHAIRERGEAAEGGRGPRSG